MLSTISLQGDPTLASTDKRFNLSQMSKDILTTALVNLSWWEVNAAKVVCRQWKTTIEGLDFIYRYFPKFKENPSFKFESYSARLTGTQLAAIVHRYAQQAKERAGEKEPLPIKLKFQLYQLKDQEWECFGGLAVKIKHLSFLFCL